MKRLFLSGLLFILFSCSTPAPKVSEGITYRVIKDVFENHPGRYEIKVETNKEISEPDAKKISEWLLKTHKDSDTFIIFFYLPGKTSAWARVDYSPYKFEVMPKLEY